MLLTLSERHGPSALDLLGLALILIGYVPMAAQVSASATTAPPWRASAACEAVRLHGIRMRTKLLRTTRVFNLRTLVSRPEFAGIESRFFRTPERCLKSMNPATQSRDWQSR